MKDLIKQKFSQIKKRHVKRVVVVLFALLWMAGPIDLLTNDEVTVTGTLYAKTYSTGKHDVTFRGHYSFTYNGVQATKALTFYESDWNDLKVNSSTREFTISESEFQSGLRSFWAFITTVLSCVAIFAGTSFFAVRWFITDDDGNWPEGW